MELFINECSHLTQCQTRILRSISIMQPSDLYLFGGESGTGKTMSLLSALSMTSKIANNNLRIVFVSPNAKMLGSVLEMFLLAHR